jgi:hypothetical protein
MTEVTGTTLTDVTGNGRNGIAKSDISTWTFDTTGPLGSAPLFGTGKVVNMLTAPGTDFATCCDWDEYSIMFFSKMLDADSWASATVYAAVFFTSANGDVGINRAYHPYKDKANNLLLKYYMNNDADAEISHAITTLGWMQHVITISKSAAAGAGEVKWFLNNVQIGATEAFSSAWSEAALNMAVIGGFSTVPANPWPGWIQGFALWNKILSETERNKVFF